jgi:hypothetical protein
MIEGIKVLARSGLAPPHRVALQVCGSIFHTLIAEMIQVNGALPFFDFNAMRFMKRNSGWKAGA